MTRVWRCGSLIGGLMLGLACGTEQPTAPRPVPAPPTITQPPRPLPSGEPVATYVSLTTRSQYLLYDNGVFGLRYDAFPHVYLGTYRQDNATITFLFDGQGIATGTLRGDLLEVRYSEMMLHSDFENAVYRRSQ